VAIQAKLLLHNRGDSHEASWTLSHGESGDATLRQGTLREAAAEIGDHALSVFIPSIDCLFTTAELPKGRRQQLLRALPYALEDRLIDDVEQLHCALGQQDKDGLWSVCVIAHQVLQDWLERLRQEGLQPQSMAPDVLLLPTEENTWHGLVENDLVYMRIASDGGFVCTPDALAKLLSSEFIAITPPEAIHISGKLIGLPEDLNESTEVLIEASDTSIRDYLPLQIPAPTINLLQGPYTPERRFNKYLRPWYPAVALTGLLVMLAFSNSILEYQDLRQRNEQLDTQMLQVFKRMFPQAQKVRNPYQRMQSELRKMGAGSEQYLFTEILADIAPIAQKTKGLYVEQLRYNQGRIEVLLEMPDLEALERFKQRLSDATPWEIELKSANASGKKVQGRLLIRGAS
jgi:general secretion pathway protein L